MDNNEIIRKWKLITPDGWFNKAVNGALDEVRDNTNRSWLAKWKNVEIGKKHIAKQIFEELEQIDEKDWLNSLDINIHKYEALKKKYLGD